MTEQTTNEYQNEQLDLAELIQYLWQKKLTYIIACGLVLVLTVVILLMLPNKYRSTVLVAPVQENDLGMLSSLASQFGGLASIAGIDLSEGSNKVNLAIELLRSREFLTDFVRRNQLEVHLMAVDGWDHGNNQPSVDNDEYDVITKTWVRDVSSPKTVAPSNNELYEAFLELISLSVDSETGFISISIDYYSPKLAKEWLDLLIRDINKTVKNIDVEQARNSIKYLTDQISQTSVASIQEALSELIEEQTKIIMLSVVREEYIFQTIDPAYVSDLDEEISPKRAMIAVISLLFSGGVVTIILLLQFTNRKN